MCVQPDRNQLFVFPVKIDPDWVNSVFITPEDETESTELRFFTHTSPDISGGAGLDLGWGYFCQGFEMD